MLTCVLYIYVYVELPCVTAAIRLRQVTCLPGRLVLQRVESQLSAFNRTQTYNARFFVTIPHISSSPKPHPNERRSFAEYPVLARLLTAVAFRRIETT